MSAWVLDLGLFEARVLREAPQVLRRRAVCGGRVDLLEARDRLQTECISHMNKIIAGSLPVTGVLRIIQTLHNIFDYECTSLPEVESSELPRVPVNPHPTAPTTSP